MSNNDDKLKSLYRVRKYYVTYEDFEIEAYSNTEAVEKANKKEIDTFQLIHENLRKKDYDVDLICTEERQER